MNNSGDYKEIYNDFFIKVGRSREAYHRKLDKIMEKIDEIRIQQVKMRMGN